MRRVTGIGGIFFKAKDAPALQAWYKRHLGIDVQEWGVSREVIAVQGTAVARAGRDPPHPGSNSSSISSC